MRLTKRLNNILLPVIAGVFLISAYTSDRIAETKAYEDAKATIRLGFDAIAGNIVKNTNTLDALIEQFLASYEYVSYVVAPGDHRAISAVESLLVEQRELARQISDQPDLIQLIDAAGRIVVSADDRDIFDDPALPDIPDEYRFWEDAGVIKTENHRFLYRTEDGGIKLGYVSAFNVDNFAMTSLRGQFNRDHMLYFLAVVDVSDFGARKRFDSDLLITDYQFNITNRLTATEFASSDEIFSYTGPYFQGEMTLQPQALTLSFKKFRWRNLMLGLGLILFCYVFLFYLIRNQVVRPITDLTEIISRGDEEAIVEKVGNDEITQLNNAYFHMIGNVQKLARFDSLTNLANRESFRHHFQSMLRRAAESGEHLSLLYIDLDNFKQVNDHYGHDAGDKLLIEFSRRLMGLLRAGDRLAVPQAARLAGDEFSVLLPRCSGVDAGKVAARILSLFDDGFSVDGYRHSVKASIGISVYPEDGENIDTLIAHGDAAMYQAKGSGRNRYQHFNQEIALLMQERIRIEAALNEAIEEDQFYLVFMPTYETSSLKIVGAEVLLRARNDYLGDCGPDKFIPVAESTGLIKKIDLWVIEKAIAHLKALISEHEFTGIISLNISSVELHNKHFVEDVIQLFEKTAAPVAQLEFEVTETSLVAHDQQSIDTLTGLKSLGLKLALDDFGTGYTGFNQLMNYPVDSLKIDRSFVSGAKKLTAKEEKTLKIMIELANIYGLATVAEGIETLEQLEYLSALGCNAVQGYYFSKPVSDIEFVDMLTASVVAV